LLAGSLVEAAPMVSAVLFLFMSYLTPSNADTRGDCRVCLVERLKVERAVATADDMTFSLLSRV
jgi:hypothetical protein